MSQPPDDIQPALEPLVSARSGAEGDEEFKLAPEEPIPPLPAEAIPPPKFSFPPLPEPPPAPVRYSLREMLILTAVAAALLAVLRIVGATIFAATTGILAFVILVVLSYLRPQRTAIHLAWWLLMGVYLLASLLAILKIQM